MKKLLAILLLLVCLLTQAAASYSLHLGAGNDRWGLGLVRNDDDQLSYSLKAELEAEQWFMRLDVDGITNRGWREGWRVSDSSVSADVSGFFSGRLDYARFSAGIRWKAFEAGLFSLYAEPALGIALAGNLHTAVMQNLVHSLSSRPELGLEYDWGDAVRLYLHQSLLLRSSFSVLSFEHSSLLLSLEGYAEASYGFSSSEAAAVRLSLDELFSFSLGYQLSQSWSGSATMGLYNEFIKGWYYDFRLNSGLLSLEYTTFLKSNFGYGTIMVDVLGLLDERRWQQENLSLLWGKSFLLGKSYNQLALELPLRAGLALTAGLRSDTGKQYDTAGYPCPRITRNYLMALLGIRYSHPIEALDEWLTPSVSLSAGVFRWQYDRLYNMDAEGVWDTPSAAIGPLYSFILDLEAGLALLPPDLIISGSCNLQIRLSAGLLLLADPTVTTASYWNVSDYLLLGCLIPHYGLALELGFDL